MAAECEINDCGVLAIGRCTGCGRAMCVSHQAHDYVDECSECRSAHYKASADAFEEANRRTERARRQVQAIARSLVDAGFPPDCFLQEGTRFKDRWIGGQKQVRDRSADVYGWFVGEYAWREREGGMYGGDRETEKQIRTYVTSHGSITRAGTGWYSEDELCGSGYLFWEELASKMIIIAREHGVRIEG